MFHELLLAAQMLVPRYDHVFVIVEENKSYADIIGKSDAPALNALARDYGLASKMYAVAHPSEPNYVALAGGSTFGIRDDGPYTVNSVAAPSIASQLDAAHLTWKTYAESIPSPGFRGTFAGEYASKHVGLLNFVSVQRDPGLSRELVGFDRLWSDLRSDTAPAFAFVIPNLCDDMHGAPECPDSPALVRRGDRHAHSIVSRIMASPLWRERGNAAIVITWDEDDDGTGPGGGHIPAIVITNHGPRHAVDGTPYTHYSLLRTIEDAFGIRSHLGEAASAAPMTGLF